MSADMEPLENAVVNFGLESQGHIPTILRMLQEGCTWDEIAKSVNWDRETLELWYCRWLLAKVNGCLKSTASVLDWDCFLHVRAFHVMAESHDPDAPFRVGQKVIPKPLRYWKGTHLPDSLTEGREYTVMKIERGFTSSGWSVVVNGVDGGFTTNWFQHAPERKQQ